MSDDCILRTLSWDSDFFNLRIGRVDIKSFESREAFNRLMIDSQSLPYDLIYVFDEVGDNLLCSNALLVDTKVFYGKELDKNSQEYSGPIYKFEGDIPDSDLYSLALVSGQYSRYRLDNHFPNGSYERLYQCWIENSVNGTLADVVLFYGENDSKSGLITLKQRGTNCSIGLIAVAPECQGKGVGRELICGAESWLYRRGGRFFEVATQRDNPACFFYERMGFRQISATKIYHIWL